MQQRESRTRKSPVTELLSRLNKVVSDVVGGNWRKYVSLNAMSDKSVRLDIKRSINGTLLSRLNDALQKFATKFRGVTYDPAECVISIA